MSYQQSPIRFRPGINPEPDETNQNTINIIDGNHVRFRRGAVEKMGGHALKVLDSDLEGCPRSVISFEESDNKWQIIGTNEKLYAALGSTVYNITPLKTTKTATLGSDPLATEYNGKNLLSYTEAFDNAAWTKTEVTIGADATTDPDGNSTADKLEETSATDFHRVLQDIDFTDTESYTVSVYAKADERDELRIDVSDSAVGAGNYANFDLTAGTATAVGNVSASIEALANDWFRCVAQFTATATVTESVTLNMLKNGNISYAGTTGEGLFLWGAQVEQAGSVTAYQPGLDASFPADIVVTYTSHGLSVGDRIKLAGASNFGGLTASTAVNIEHIVKAVRDANTFTIEAPAEATSEASGGGSSIDIFYEIDDGGCDASAASGPGIGTPGLGLPGSIQTDTSLLVQPRIWWLDVFGDKLVCGPGQSGDCYEWDGDTTVAPVKITNSPAADWAWVEDAKLVTLNGNTITNSDTGNLTNWSSGSYYTDDKEDATKLIGRAYANGENLIFAEENKIFKLRWVGGTIKWVWEIVSNTIGVMGPNCARTVGNIIFIFGKDNLYYYNGGLLRPIPNNSLIRYMLEDYNIDQRYKFFVWYNQEYDEMNFHYCSGTSDEIDRCIVASLSEGWFSKREDLDRTAADDSGVFPYPVLASSDGKLYQHETGYNDAGSAMNAFFRIAYQAAENGRIYTEISGMELDMIQTGDMTIELWGKNRSRDTAELIESFTVAQDDQVIECDHDTRWRSWLFRSNVVDGFFRSGAITEFVQGGSEF